MEVHDIADFASRIGKGLMEQVIMTCRVPVVSLDSVRFRFLTDTGRQRQEKKDLCKPDTTLEDNLKSLTKYYKNSAIALAWTMKKNWHKAESAVKEITWQTAVATGGVSDSRISDYLNKKDYEDNALVSVSRFWPGLCVDPQQLSIVADIIRTWLQHKLVTINIMDTASLYVQILPFFLECQLMKTRQPHELVRKSLTSSES